MVAEEGVVVGNQPFQQIDRLRQLGVVPPGLALQQRDRLVDAFDHRAPVGGDQFDPGQRGRQPPLDQCGGEFVAGLVTGRRQQFQMDPRLPVQPPGR